jgi:hypothetical protein
MKINISNGIASTLLCVYAVMNEYAATLLVAPVESASGANGALAADRLLWLLA